MYILLIAIALLGCLAALLGLLRNRKYKQMLDRGEIDRLPEVGEPQEECCGQHAVCEKDSLLAAVSKEVEYYNDEELDAYQGIASADYLPEQTDLFAEVFYTLREEEVAGWIRSLQLRGIELPDALKDECFMLLAERRIH